MEDHHRAISVFKGCGSLWKAAQITGIPYHTLYKWAGTEWWKEGLLSLKAEDSAVLEEATTSIAKQSATVVQERLTNGDFVLSRDGTVVRKPVSARDAAIILGVSMDKRKILSEAPHTENKLGINERLLKLVEQFVQFANAKEIKGVLAEGRDDANAKQAAILEHNEFIEGENDETISDETETDDSVDLPETQERADQEADDSDGDSTTVVYSGTHG